LVLRSHAVRDIASHIYVASKQIIDRPGLLIDAIRKADLKALYIPDRKRILLDEDLPKIKHRWNEAHEIGHSVVPWHKLTMLGDNKMTLSQACSDHTEREANYAAGRLLFFGDRFGIETNDSLPTMAIVKALKTTYGNTLTSTLWRMVESSQLPLLGAVSVHPRRTPDDFDEAEPLRYFIRSPHFAKWFSLITETAIWNLIREYSSWARGGPLGETETILLDDNGQAHCFKFETFYNGHEALTLAVYLRKHSILISA